MCPICQRHVYVAHINDHLDRHCQGKALDTNRLASVQPTQYGSQGSGSLQFATSAVPANLQHHGQQQECTAAHQQLELRHKGLAPEQGSLQWNPSTSTPDSSNQPAVPHALQHGMSLSAPSVHKAALEPGRITAAKPTFGLQPSMPAVNAAVVSGMGGQPGGVAHPTLMGQWTFHEFVTVEEEKALLRMLDTGPPDWVDSNFNGLHRGKAWGVKMSLSKRTVHPGGVAVPPLLQCLIPRMQQLPPLRTFNPNEANAIDYWRGIHHLKPHMDDRKLSTEVIVNLSLSGRAVMTFTKQPIAGNKAGNAGGQHQIRVLLPARSLQVLTKDARYRYTHGIAMDDVLDERRVSVTFRQSPLTVT
eukprot:jgi/Chrzof1/4229/Cz14g04030.t1